jgi:hypothetical protein
MVTNDQLYLAIGIPLLFNASLILGLFVLMNSMLNSKFDAFRAEMNSKFAAIDARFDAIDQRFDDMRELWRSELRRVEEILDARLKHLESR